MESGSFFLFGRNGAVREMFMDARLPAGQFFIAPIQTEIHRKTDGATDIMTGDRIVREGIRVFAMIIMAGHIVKQISKNIRVGGHDGSGRYDGKLHATFALSPRG